MSIKQQGKKFEQKVARGSKTVGRDVKKGAKSASAKIARGARTVGRDVGKAGKRVRLATRHEVTRVRSRVARARSSKRA